MKTWWENLSKRNRTVVIGCSTAIILALIFTNQFMALVDVVAGLFK